MSAHSGYRIAGNAIAATAMVTANIASDLAPVPFLSPVVGVVVAIIQLCENVRTNKIEVKELGQRCEQLLYAIRNSSSSQAPENLQELVESCRLLLEEIKSRMIGWINTPRAKQFFLQNEISEDIKRCNQAIDAFMSNFQITSSLEIHNTMAQYEKNRQLDQAINFSYLTAISSKTIDIESSINQRTEELVRVMSEMQKQMGTFIMGDFRHSNLAQELLTLQENSGQLLPIIELKHGEVRKVGSNPVSGSATFDIWEGEYLGSKKCAIKVLRFVEVTDKIKARFLREVEIWREVGKEDHNNYILPFWGAMFGDGTYPYMVSPWMSNGDTFTYITKNPHVDRKPIIRRIAEGLALLHNRERPIIHGDIKAANILINDEGQPVLADFGLSKIMEELTGVPFTQTRGLSDSYRWFAPELCTTNGTLSPASDVFSYSMTVLEVMTGLLPFHQLKRTPEVLIKMQQGERPPRPTDPEVIARGLDDKLWNLITRCWHQDPMRRPTINQVLAELPQ